MGRIGFFLATDTDDEGQALVDRSLLAHDVLYLTRGVPVVYYGDEVGMTGSGDGTDKKARQDMFPTQVATWRTEERIGTPPVGTGSSFGESTALEARLAALSALRGAHPALASGAQITRYGDGPVFVASRIDAQARVEYLIAFNNSDEAATVSVPTSTPSSAWTGLLGSGSATSDATGRVSLTVPALSSVVLQAAQPMPVPAAPSVSLRTAKDVLTSRYRLTATVPGTDPSSVTFLMRRQGQTSWTVVGTDDARPFRVYVPPQRGVTVDLAAVVRDSAGQTAQTAPVRLGISPFL